VRRGDVDAPALQLGDDGALVLRREVGVEQAHGDGGNLGRQRGQRRRRHRHQLGAGGVEPAPDAEPQRPRHQRRRSIGERVVERGSILAADLEHVLVALGGDQGDDRAASLQQRVGGDGRAVRQPLDGTHHRERRRHRPAGIVGGRRHLDDGAVVAHQVGERPAGVDPDVHQTRPDAPRRS
jgi:hypothetical protein